MHIEELKTSLNKKEVKDPGSNFMVVIYIRYQTLTSFLLIKQCRVRQLTF